jgi:hypothetical protein
MLIVAGIITLAIVSTVRRSKPGKTGNVSDFPDLNSN